MNNDKTMLELIYKELIALRQEIAYIQGRQDGMQEQICYKLDSIQERMPMPIFDDRFSNTDYNTIICKK